MSRYADRTIVSVQITRAEIDTILAKHGATAFMSGSNENEAMVAFECNNRRVVFRLPIPAVKSFERTTARGLMRSNAEKQKAWEQECRSRWRALYLCIKAKLEAVAVNITTFENEFMAHIVMPDGQTVGQHVSPKIAQAYDSGTMPPLLLGHG
ncbi:MAG: hypothetical protein ABL951_02655 [Alphaproteobacteria bacterium]